MEELPCDFRPVSEMMGRLSANKEDELGITISVQNMNHNEMESFSGAAADTLSDIVLDSPTGPMMRGIHKYADTMFNSYQLKFFLEELDSANPRSDSERELFSVLRRASESAIRQQGYLWFSGD